MPDAEAERVVREAYEMGYTFFDTAECYVGMRPDGTKAHNEDVVGAARRSVTAWSSPRSSASSMLPTARL